MKPYIIPQTEAMLLLANPILLDGSQSVDLPKEPAPIRRMPLSPRNSH